MTGSERRLGRIREVLGQRLGWVSCAIEAVYHRHNASAILRTCDALGVHTVHIVEGHFRAARGAARGAERWLDVRHAVTPAVAIAAIRAEGRALWVADLADPPTSPEEIPLDRPICLWFGAELIGVGPEARAAADGVVTIPMRGFAQSLNVSVAAALALRPVAERARALGDKALLPPAIRGPLLEEWLARERDVEAGVEAHRPRPSPGRRMTGARALGWMLVSAALAWHFAEVLGPSWKSLGDNIPGRDFASYYYAAEVAEQGGDPWSKQALAEASRAEDTRRSVHPFLYPPPFLLAVAWAPALDLHRAFETWFWLDEVFAIAAVLALWQAWRPLGRSLPVALALLAAALTALPNNHAMGQANLLPLTLVAAGWWAEDRGRPGLGGALVGAACMLKMSPALFVILWLVQRNWRAVTGAVATAVALSEASLPLVGPWTQLRFYTDVLPTFSSGSYNGLGVGIQLYGNHSIPNIIDRIWPGTGSLSPMARLASGAVALALVGGLALAFRRPHPDPLVRAARYGAFGVVLLLIPVYTYEHHLVWAIPAALVLVMALGQGRLGVGWAVPVGVALAVWAFDLELLKETWEGLRGTTWALLFLEPKTCALLVFLAATVRLGVTRNPG